MNRMVNTSLRNLRSELKHGNREAAELARRSFTASGIEDRLLAAHTLADHTILARGLFEWDSERIQVSPA
jgi:hypothetical protein